MICYTPHYLATTLRVCTRPPTTHAHTTVVAVAYTHHRLHTHLHSHLHTHAHHTCLVTLPALPRSGLRLPDSVDTHVWSARSFVVRLDSAVVFYRSTFCVASSSLGYCCCCSYICYRHTTHVRSDYLCSPHVDPHPTILTQLDTLYVVGFDLVTFTHSRLLPFHRSPRLPVIPHLTFNFIHYILTDPLFTRFRCCC